MKNNRGFTLVEMMLVICIMAIAATVSVVAVNLIGSTNVSKAANQLDTALKRARSISMSKGSMEGLLRLSSDGSDIYYQIGSNDKVKLVDGDYIDVYYKMSGGSEVLMNYTTLNTSVMYNPASGIIIPTPPATNAIESIKLQRGEKIYIINFYQQTGKHKLVAG